MYRQEAKAAQIDFSIASDRLNLISNGIDVTKGQTSMQIASGIGTSNIDYIALQASWISSSSGFAINIHNGEIIPLFGIGHAYPGGEKPGAMLTIGSIIGGANSQSEYTSNFLKGTSGQVNGFLPLPVPVGGAVTYSYGGGVATEFGISTSPGGHTLHLDMV